jgi:hypothetical protein
VNHFFALNIVERATQETLATIAMDDQS